MAQRSQPCLNLADCYRTLGLQSGASYREIKGAYRRLARQYHPDVNDGDRDAQHKFIELTTAYKYLLERVPLEAEPSSSPLSNPQSPSAQSSTNQSSTNQSSTNQSATPERTAPDPSIPNPTVVQFSPELSEMDRRLKQHSYDQLQLLLKTQRFPRAIALVEGLAQRLPEDGEVRQWQAITYQRWGRQLIQTQQYDKARVYLKKALKTDPHNRALWAEVEREFQRLEKVY